MKPILFNTEMVKAILAGRKSVTRRVVKFKAGQNPAWTGYIPDGTVLYGSNNIPAAKAPYRLGDILYVRETWTHPSQYEIANGANPNGYLYRADDLQPAAPDKWRPSIHMPKEAARLFLLITDVRTERLQDMTEEDAFDEGYDGNPWCYHKVWENYPDSPIPCYAAGSPRCPPDPPCNHSIPELFGMKVWNNTFRPAALKKYGWEANPWVWVIAFERISKEGAMQYETGSM